VLVGGSDFFSVYRGRPIVKRGNALFSRGNSREGFGIGVLAVMPAPLTGPGSAPRQFRGLPDGKKLLDGIEDHLAAGRRQERRELLLATVATEVSRRPGLKRRCRYRH